MEVLTTDEALKTLKGSSARPFHSDVLDTEEAIKILRAHSQVEKREPKVYTVSKPQEPRTYHRNADGLMTQVVTQPTVKQQKQADNAARLDALAGRTGAQKDLSAPLSKPQAIRDFTTGDIVQTVVPKAQSEKQSGGLLAGIQNLMEAANPVAKGVDMLRYLQNQEQAKAQADGIADQRIMELREQAKTNPAVLHSDEYIKAMSRPVSLFSGMVRDIPQIDPEGKSSLDRIAPVMQSKRAEAQNELLEGKTGLGKKGTQALIAGADMLGSAGLAGMTGVPYLGVMAGQSGADAGQRALDEGHSYDKAALFAAGTGGITAGIESFGGAAGKWGDDAARALAKTKIGQAVLSKVPDAVGKKLSDLASSKLGKIAADALSEGSEEFAEYYAQNFFENLMLDKDTPYDMRVALESAAVGSMFGGMFGGGRAAADLFTGRNVNAQAAQPAQESAFTRQAGTDANAVQSNVQQTTAADGVIPYSLEESARIRKSAKTFRNIVEGVDTSIRDFFVKWKTGKPVGSLLEKLYLGKVGDGLAQKLSDAFGYPVKSSDFILTNDNVAHIFNRHGNVSTEEARGNIPITEENINRLIETINAPDAVSPGSITNSGRRSAIIEKAFPDGTAFCVEVDNAGRGTLETVTFYIKKNKSATPMGYAAEAPIPYTSKTTGPALSDPTVPQTEPGVNTSIPGSGAENDMLAGIRDLREPDMLAEAGNPNGFTGLVSNQNASRVSRRVRRALNAAGKKLGVAVVFDTSLHGDNGSYDPKTKTLRIAMDASDPLRVIFTHEATHRLKETSPELYAQFEEMALDALRESGSYDRVQYAVEKAYGEQAFREEAAAHFTRLLTEDIGEFEKLVGVNRNLAQKLLDLLDEVLHSAGAGWDGLGTASGDQDLLFGNYTPEQLTKLRDAWAEMLQKADAGAQGQGDVRHSVMFDADQKPYVVVDADILQGVPKSQWVRTVKNTFRQLYPDGIDMGFFRVKQNRDSRNEYTNSKYTQKLRNTNAGLYRQKMRMVNNLGEIVQNAYGTRNEGLKHPRNDNYQSFNHGTIDVRIGAQDYNVQVVTAIDGYNNEVFYDIVGIQPTKITEAAVQANSLYKDATSADPRIPQTEPGVNPYSMQEGRKYSRPLDARRALDEDAEGTDMKRLIADNRRMQKNIEALREQFYRSKPGQTSESAVRAKAREWRGEWKTRMKAEEITERLREIYRLAGDRRSEYSFSQYENDLKALAGEMLEDVSAGVSPEAQEVLSSVKNLRMTLSEQDRADFQDYEAFRREHLGRIRLVNQGGIEVNSAYQELSERFPYLFPESVTRPADQLRQIGDIVERMAVEENPYEHDMEYYTGVLTQEMMDAFWEIPAKKPTFADVMEKKAADAYQRGREKGEQSAQRQAERMNAQLEAVKRDRDERIAREREKNRNRRTDEMIKRIRAQDRQKLLRIAQKAEKLKAAPDVKARIAELIGDLDTQSVGILKDGYLRKDGVLVRGETDLRELRDLYWEARENNPDFLANPEVENSIARLDKKQIADMDIDDVRNLTRAVQAIMHEVKTSNELIADQSRRDASQVRKQVMEELRSAARKKPKNLLAGLGQTVYNVKSLRPKTFFADISGYAHGATEHLYQVLEDGQTKMLDFQRKATQPFDEYSKAHQKQMAEWTGPKAKLFDAGIVRDGKHLLITPMMKMSLALHAENDTNLAHIKDGGITVPDAELYRKGKINEAYDQGYTVKLTPSEVKRIAGSLTEDERAFVALAREFFNRQSKQALNETSLELNGYEIANVDHYFPIKIDRDFGRSNFENLVKDGTIEGMGILKKRTEARNPIMLEGLDNVLARQISDVSKYYGMAIPVRNFNKVWSGSTLGYEGSAKKSMREAIGTEGSRYIEKLMKDIQSPHQSADALEKVLDRLRGNFAAATLNFNPSVAMSQAASYPTAAQVLGWKALGRGLTMKPASLELIDKYTPLLWYRSKGYASTDMADMKNAKSWVQKLPGSGWIQGADIATVRQLWNAAEAWTQMNTDLVKGSEDYYRKTAEMFNRTVYDTQPNYTTLQRPDILRADSGLLKSIMMFQTQRMQNYNMMYETWNEMRAAKRNGRDVGKARAAAGATAATLLIANGVYTAMKAAVAGLIDRDKDYSEKDGTVSPGSWAAGYFRNFVKNMAGSVLFASELAEIGETVLTGKSYDLIEVPPIAAINDLVSGGEAFARSLTDWASKTARGEGTMLEYLDMNGAKVCGNARKLALGIARCCGLPAENVEKYTIGILGQVSPGLAAQYENLYRKKTLADIAEVSGTRKGQSVFDVVLENRAGEMNKAVSKELYRLYKAVGKDAMPAAIPEEASGEKLTPKQYSAAHKNYSDVMQDALETALESKAYQNASDKQKAGMVKYVSELQKYAALKKEGIGDTVKWKEAALKGDGDFAARFSMAQYMYGEIEGNDTNRDGKTDPGSKKAAFSKWLNNAGFSASEKRKIMEYFYKS